MRTTLVINLTRFGDLIQTQPVLSGYKKKGDRVVLLCLEQFAKAAELLADVDAIFSLPGARLLAGLDTQWTKALADLWAFVASLDQEESLNVINLTPTLSSRLLGNLYAPGSQLGFGLDEHGFGLYSSPWANFLQASSKLRGCSPFNLVDIMVRAAHLPHTGEPPRLKEPHPEILAWSMGQLKEQAPSHCKGFVAFQLGASRDVRRWPVAHFVKLGKHLWEHHKLCPVLVGAKNETHLGDTYLSLSKVPCVNMMGKTGLDQLAGILRQTRLLITNDTGTMHLAAALGLPLIALFLTTAQPWDTGPYQKNCVCLEPDMECHPCSFSSICEYDHACRHSISPEVVGELVDNFLATETWNITAGQKCRVWKTLLNKGMLDLVSLNDSSSDRVSWIRIQQWYYRHFLDEQPLSPLSASYPLTIKAQQEIITTLTHCLGLLQLFREQMILVQKMPSEVMSKKLLLTWQKIQTNFDNSHWFGMLGLLWTYQTQDVSSNNLDPLFALVVRYEQLVDSLCEYVRENKSA